jgi:hypothetical protein
MSSRSFRRRNSRRRRRQGTAGGGFPGSDGAYPAEGGGADPAGGKSQGEQGNQDPGDHHGSRSQGGRPQGGRPQAGRPRGGKQQPARPAPDRQPREAAQHTALRQEPPVPIVLPDCPVCGKPVRELASALTHRVSRKPAHFDCVVRELRESNEVAPQEKICYLGGGSFGILEFRGAGGTPRFVIKKRIQYEEKEAPQEWKKPLQVSC